MNGMLRTQFQVDHARLDLQSEHACSDFLSREAYEEHSSTVIKQNVLTFDRCRPHSVTFGYY